MERELASLQEHGVFEVLTPEETSRVRKNEVLPMLALPGIKPADEAGYRRKKIRGVVCGNFQPVHPSERLFTNNVDISSVRIGLAIAAERKWAAAVLDVSTAFLNASLPEDTPEVIMRPPPVFIKFGLVKENTLWRAIKAIYGLRVAPRAWGDERDENFRVVVIDIEAVPHKLRQSMVDPAVWSVVKLEAVLVDAHDSAVGYLLVYVDDCLILGPPAVVKAVEETLLQTWACTTHPHISFQFPGELHYLGLTLVARHDCFVLHQKEYLQELLTKWGLEECRGCQCIDADAEEEAEEPEEPPLADVRMAQKMGGGLIWVSSRTRPDVAYAVSRISSAAAKRPQWALRLGKRTLRYLAMARDYGLLYKSDGGGIVGFADASFNVLFSQTGVDLYYKGMNVEWRSCKQPVVARSTAEAEVSALAMGLVMIEGLEAVLHSMFIDPGVPTLFGDNNASICLANRQGSWRTRSLSNKAAGLRSRLDLGSIILSYVGTKEQRADGLTMFLNAMLMHVSAQMLGLHRV